MSDYYNSGSAPSTGSFGSSAAIRAEFSAISSGISDKLPPLTGVANNVVVINPSSTGMTTMPLADMPVSTAQAASIAGRYGMNNILGTVSKVAGVPTGQLIETISNANGIAKRFADGTQICLGVFPDLVIGANVVASPVARTFAAAFAEATPVVSYSCGLSLSTDFYGCVFENLNSFTQCQPAFRNGATAQSVVQIRYTAVGRWIL